MQLRVLQLPLLWPLDILAQLLAPLTSLRELVLLLVPNRVGGSTAGGAAAGGEGGDASRATVEGVTPAAADRGGGRGGHGDSALDLAPLGLFGEGEEQKQQRGGGQGPGGGGLVLDENDNVRGSGVILRNLRNCWVKYE